MDERAWVGPVDQAPVGWTVFPSLEAFLDSPLHPGQIVLDDRAAVLREADFLRVYAHSPLAQITRCAGPWRAGIGRTDPAWPLVTTCRSEGEFLDESAWRPLTSGYDGLAAEEELLDLSGVSVGVWIADPELRGMWVDSLASAGSELVSDAEAEVQIVAGVSHPDLPRTHERATPLLVSLRPDPWNAVPDSPREIVASVLDSPWSVMQRISRRLKRGDREAD